VTLKIATVMPAGSPWTEALQRFAAEVKRKTNDQVLVQIYAGAVAGDESRALQRMRSGQIHGMAGASAGLSALEPALRLLELPFMFRTQKEWDFVQRSLLPVFASRLDAKGYRLIALASVGWVHLYSKHPTRTLTELRTRRVWRWENDPIAAGMLDVLGIPNVKLSITDVLPSLQAGTIDTAYGMAHSTQALQWHTSVSHIIDYQITMATATVVLRKDAFTRLTAAQQQVITQAGATLQQYIATSSAAINDKAMRAMLAGGMKRVLVSAEMVTQLRALRDRIYQRYVGSLLTAADLKQVEALVSLCRASSCR
jgi:TRAP-type C4-dicarboxylate transport system substrate-binding protein